MTAPTHPAITAYLNSLRAADKASTATTSASFLAKFEHWLQQQGVDVLHATPEVLAHYQLWLANDYRTVKGQPLAISTQATALIVVKTLYGWLERRGAILLDPTAKLIPPDPPRRLVAQKDHLTLQEATALLDTLAALVTETEPGFIPWALAIRNLAAIALALATGRRCQGLCHLKVEHLDMERNEVRVDQEKGKAGRVLPVAPWAMGAVQRYLSQSRLLLLRGRVSPWLLVSFHADRLCERGFAFLLDAAMKKTISRNGDLTDLPHKRISPHSLRVTFASTLMFAQGCGIRSLNELMLHSKLTTTAQYTPIPLEDMRRALLTNHPHA
jgi:site-specific recombinase XerD